MEIAFIPRWLLKYLSKDYLRQIDYNILISNIIIVIIYIVLKEQLLFYLDNVPHFCLIDNLFGIECPACGITRAFSELSNGNIKSAAALNYTSLFLAIFLIMQIPLRLMSLLFVNTRGRIIKLSKYSSRLVLTILLLCWIMKLIINQHVYKDWLF